MFPCPAVDEFFKRDGKKGYNTNIIYSCPAVDSFF